MELGTLIFISRCQKSTFKFPLKPVSRRVFTLLVSAVRSVMLSVLVYSLHEHNVSPVMLFRWY